MLRFGIFGMFVLLGGAMASLGAGSLVPLIACALACYAVGRLADKYEGKTAAKKGK